MTYQSFTHLVVIKPLEKEDYYLITQIYSNYLVISLSCKAQT